MQFCGIDTGSRIIGYAITTEYGEVVSNGSMELASGVPDDFSSKEALMWRLNKLQTWMNDFMLDLLEGFGQEIVVGIESPWVGKNPQTALKLGKAWGIVAAMAMSWGLEVYDISPAEAKQAITGDSGASKDVVMKYARMLKPEVASQDEADAISVALATRKKYLERKLGESTQN